MDSQYSTHNICIVMEEEKRKFNEAIEKGYTILAYPFMVQILYPNGIRYTVNHMKGTDRELCNLENIVYYKEKRYKK